jgi:hypothetical protein
VSLKNRLARLERAIDPAGPTDLTPFLKACTDAELDALEAALLTGDQAEVRRIVEQVCEREGLVCP